METDRNGWVPCMMLVHWVILQAATTNFHYPHTFSINLMSPLEYVTHHV